MKKFYYIFIFFSIFLYSNNIYSICSTYYPTNKSIFYPTNFKHLNYTNINAKQKGTLKLITPISFNTLNPFDITKQLPPYYLLLVYDSLFISPLDDVNTMYPLIAKNFCITNNTLIINLNNKAKWNNHSPIIAKDILFSIQSATTSQHPLYSNLANNIKSIKIINNFSLSIEFYHLSDTHLYSLFSLPIISSNNHTFSGPYEIDKINFGKEIMLTKNHNYWAINFPIRRYQFNFNKIIITTQSIAYNLFDEFKNHNIDYYMEENFQTLALFNDKFLTENNLKTITTTKVVIPKFYGLFFNLSKEHLKDINVRKAVVLAYDFTYVNNKFFNKSYKQFDSLFINSKFYNSKATNLTSDLKLASVYLDSSNFIFINNVRIHNFTKNPLTLNIIFSNEETLATSIHWMHNLELLGIKINYKLVDESDIYSYIKNNNYDVIEQSYMFSDPPQDELLAYFSNFTQFNYTKLQNKDINKLITNKDFKKLDKALFEMKIFLPLYYNPIQYYIVNKDLHPMFTPYGVDLMSSYFE